MGQIDWLVAIFTLAEAYAGIEELDTAEKLYARVIHELRDERWKTEALASHATYLCGRAFVGCAKIEVWRSKLEVARKDLDLAVNYLLDGDPWSVLRALEEVARLYEGSLDDAAAAMRLRALMKERYG